jgi:hypothetical protein
MGIEATAGDTERRNEPPTVARVLTVAQAAAQLLSRLTRSSGGFGPGTAPRSSVPGPDRESDRGRRPLGSGWRTGRLSCVGGRSGG